MTMTVEIIDSLESFDAVAEHWNQLWERSQSHVAFHRSEPIRLFLEAFDLQDRFRAVLVRSDDQLVTALPLTIRRCRIGGWEGQSIANEWAIQACLLDLPVGDPADRARAINDGFQKLNLTRVKLDWMPLDWAAPKRLCDQWRQQHRAVWVKPRFQVHKMLVPHDWHTFYCQVSRNTQKTIQRAKGQLSKLGPVTVEGITLAPAHELQDAIQTAMAIEHAGWKGSNGSSLLSFPGIADYYRLSFLELAKQRLTRLYFLKVGDQRIAFDLGYLAAGVYSSIKVSYLPDFSKFSPGNLLNGLLLERFCETNEADWIDCIGPATDSTGRWTDAHYISGRMTLSTGSLLSNVQVMFFNTAASMMGKNTL